MNDLYERSLLFWKDFIIRADDDVARLEQLDGEMIQSYQHLCDFLAIDIKNYTITEFFIDLKSFCTFYSVKTSHCIIIITFFVYRLVFKKFVHGVNKPLEQRKHRKYSFDVYVHLDR